MPQPSQLRNYSGTDLQAGNPASQHRLAVISAILGVTSLLIAGPITGIPGLLVGFRARAAASRGAANRKLVLAGIVMSALGTIGAIVLIVWVAANGLPASLA